MIMLKRSLDIIPPNTDWKLWKRWFKKSCFFFSVDDAIIKILPYKARMSNLVAFSERQSEDCEALQASFRPNQAPQWRIRISICSMNSSGFWLSSSSTKTFSICSMFVENLSSLLLQSDTTRSAGLLKSDTKPVMSKNICPNCAWQKRNIDNEIHSIELCPKPPELQRVCRFFFKCRFPKSTEKSLCVTFVITNTLEHQ